MISRDGFVINCTVTPMDSTFSCRICEDYHMEAAISINYLGPLTKTEGKSVLSSFKSNKDLIYSHHKTKVHNTNVNYLKKKEESKLLQGFQKAEKISSDK